MISCKSLLLSTTILNDYNIDIFLQDYISLNVPENCMFSKRKRSIDSTIVRHGRQSPAVITFPNVTIDQSIVTMISDTLLPAVVNVSLNSTSGKCNCGIYCVHMYMHVHNYHNFINYKILVFTSLIYYMHA